MNYRPTRITWRRVHRLAWHSLPVLFAVAVAFLFALFVLAVTVGDMRAESGKAPVVSPTMSTQDAGQATLQEDDEGWDCRTMGNKMCGVEVMGEWYVLDFTTSTFAPRG